MNLSFKNRIALHYMVATAIIMATVFSGIYLIVKQTVLKNLDSDLSSEAKKHFHEITITGDSIHFINKAEWEEREHQELQLNPVFIQVMNIEGQIMDRSPNLKNDSLYFDTLKFGEHFHAQLNQRAIRQIQIPMELKGKVRGYLLAAISSSSSLAVIQRLKNVLLFSYLIVLAGLYFISRFLAGRSLIPIRNITHTITRITNHNLKERVDLPVNKDEIHELSSSFNDLIERIEKALEREKQFTSDASHELRTPLATLRGTLEVLIRKPRSPQEYEEKIQYSLTEIERMTNTLEQLLLLARLDIKSGQKEDNLISLPTLVNEALSRMRKNISDKNLKIELKVQEEEPALVSQYYSTLIIDNILNNSIKYSDINATIRINIFSNSTETICTIQDFGLGIEKKDQPHIYDNFFRSDSLNHKQIAGNGLGLSIVKKCADAIRATIDIESTLGSGTTVRISF